MQYYLASELDDEEGENEEDLYDEEDEEVEEANEESVDWVNTVVGILLLKSLSMDYK